MRRYNFSRETHHFRVAEPYQEEIEDHEGGEEEERDGARGPGEERKDERGDGIGDPEGGDVVEEGHDAEAVAPSVSLTGDAADYGSEDGAEGALDKATPSENSLSWKWWVGEAGVPEMTTVSNPKSRPPSATTTVLLRTVPVETWAARFKARPRA